MTAAKPLARQRVVGALASGFATAELHHHQGHDLLDLLLEFPRNVPSRISGQLSIVASGIPDNQSASFAAQAKLVLDNFLAVLGAAGAEKQDVLKVTAYIVDAENWPRFNQSFAEAFGEHRPARSVVPVPELRHGYLIEIDGVALDRASA